MPGLDGYYLQEAFGGDGDPATSDAIFVLDARAAVQQGQLLEMTGIVSSFYGMMQLMPMDEPTVCGTTPLPSPVVLHQLPTRGEAASLWDSLQAMLITVSEPTTVIGLYRLARFGEVQLSSGGRCIAPSQIYDPLSPEHDELLASYRDTLLLGDGNPGQNPDPIPFPDDGLTLKDFLRVGDTVLNVTGPLGYRYQMAIVDKAPGLPQPVHLRMNDRPEAVPEVGGRLKVSSFNVENYFNGPPLGLPFGHWQGRGAENEFEFDRQRRKTISAMVALDATIFVLAEVENNGNVPGSAVQDIVDGLNAATAAGKYATMALPDRIGGDVIANNFIYQPSLVQVAGSPAILDSAVDPTFIDTKNRPSIAITFEELSSGNRFTVVANHFKSKGSSCAACCNDVEVPGVGNCNGVRTNASIALGRWLQTNPTGVEAEDILITGDLNAYHAETPIQALIQDFGYVDMVDRFESKTEAYSFVFSGFSGYLDHMLASPSLAAKTTKLMDWHVNADEIAAFGYSTSFKSSRQIEQYYAPDPFRCSDHDPLLLGLF